MGETVQRIEMKTLERPSPQLSSDIFGYSCGLAKLKARGTLAAAPASIPKIAVRIIPVIAVDPEVFALNRLTFGAETQNGRMCSTSLGVISTAL
jgi:hypothetical protein